MRRLLLRDLKRERRTWRWWWGERVALVSAVRGGGMLKTYFSYEVEG